MSSCDMDCDVYFVIRRIEDGAMYRIKKGKSSFVESPGS
jgi:hypothetical protein